MGVFVFYVTDKSNEVVTKVCCPLLCHTRSVVMLYHPCGMCIRAAIGRCMIICLNVTACVV